MACLHRHIAHRFISACDRLTNGTPGEQEEQGRKQRIAAVRAHFGFDIAHSGLQEELCVREAG
jgi:hypothetical protein